MCTTNNLKIITLDALEEMKIDNIVTLEVSNITDLADFFIISSGISIRHVQSAAGHVLKKVAESGISPYGIEGKPFSEWVLLDFGDIVTHIMTNTARQFYDLDSFWQDNIAENC